MRRKTKIEEVTHRGEIRLEVYIERSSLLPQWWEFRRRFRWWRISQYVRTNRNKLSIETQLALAWAEEALEREFMIGNEDKQWAKKLK